MPKITPAKRTWNIKYAIRDLVVEAQKLEKQGRKILYLNIGDPMKFDFQTPRHMVDAVKANEAKSEGYADSMGLLEARAAVAKEAERKGIKGATEEDILISNGSSEGIMLCLGALMNQGENVLTPLPGYPLYTALVNYFDGKYNPYHLDEENDWQIDIDDVKKKINEKTKGIIIINPNNPTGSLYTESTLKELINLAAQHDLVIFSDEIYDKLILDNEKYYSVAALTDEVPVVTFNGLSKSYLCPGWRVGWSIFSGPKESMEEYKEACKKLARARLSSVYPTQYAVKPALEGTQIHLEETNKKLRERRDFTYKRLNEIDRISLVKPKGAFYAFAKIDVPVPDEKFVLDLLKETGVLVVNGSGFGQKEGENHFRCVFLPEINVLEEAYNSIEKFVKKNY